jgi:hypothetical protein
MERERNEPPLEAGAIDPPGAPYIVVPRGQGMHHNTLFVYTVHCS